jgi:hypothetical protein
MVKILSSKIRRGVVLACAMLPVMTGCQRPLTPDYLPSAVSVSAAVRSAAKVAKRSVIGRIYNDVGTPVTGVTVTAVMLTPDSTFANGATTFVAKVDLGDYGLANLTPPCSFNVIVDLPGYRPETQMYDLTVGGAPVVRGPVFNLTRSLRRR